MARPTLWRMAGRIATLTCPACGTGRLFRRYFVRADACSSCEWTYERGDGYWVGGSEVHMFVTYFLSVLICAPLVVILGSSPAVMIGLVLGHVALSLLLFRYSRAMFLGLDYLLDPGTPSGRDDDDGNATEPIRPRTPPVLARRRASRRERSAPRARGPVLRDHSGAEQ